MYKLVAKNEKGEATSQTVEVTELPPEEKPKGEKPKLSKLTNIVSRNNKIHKTNQLQNYFLVEYRRRQISRFYLLPQNRR